MAATITDLAYARERDRDDALAAFRTEFHFPQTADGRDVIYLCGNSLGLQPRGAAKAVEGVLESWQTRAVGGYFSGDKPWMDYAQSLCASYAAMVGADPAEIAVMNSLSVNLHLMMVSFYRPTAQRYKIMVEGGAFPSDQYAVKSQLAFHGYDPQDALIELQPRPGEHTLRTEDVLERIAAEGDSIALIMLGGIHYYTGQLHDMATITRAGQAQGCVVGFDLAHVVGNVPLQLHDWGVDFACWCAYKYLNGGPGSPAAIFIHERHAKNADLPRFAGWWGNDKSTRFLMRPDFDPAPGAAGWMLSNQPTLSMAAVRASLDLFDRAGMAALQEKSRKLTGYLEELLDALGSDDFYVMTPRDPAQRGAQLSIVVRENGRAVFDGLIKAGVICDWREPDCIRIAPVPLYCRYEDVYHFVGIFADLLGLSTVAAQQA